jgi:hypothetical protein
MVYRINEVNIDLLLFQFNQSIEVFFRAQKKLNCELQKACIVVLASFKIIKALEILSIQTEDEKGLRQSLKSICISIINFVI